MQGQADIHLQLPKKGGVVFVSYCMNEATIVSWSFQKGNILEGIENAIVDSDTFKCLSNPSLLFEMYRKEEIDELMERYNIERIHFVATDLLTNHMCNTIDEMDEKMFEAYLKYHFSICERTDLVGITHHSLDVFRKK